MVPTLLADPGDEPTQVIPVYLEDSPAAQEMVDRAFHMRDQGRLVDASAAMQQVIDQFPQKLMKIAGSQHEDAARWVRRTIRADADWLAAYRRTYEPEAARLLGMAYEQGPSIDALTAVTRRYVLCTSGLQASLELAGLWLERGAADHAATVLDDVADHPDLQVHAVRYYQLRMSQAAISGDAALLALAHAELDRLHAAVADADVQAMLSFFALLHDRGAVSAELPESFGAPLWQVPLPDAPSVDNTVLLVRMPTLADQSVLINTGVAVTALDRSSGRQIWSTGDLAAGTPDLTAGRFFHAQRLLPDVRGVTVWGDRALAVLGPDMSQMGRRNWWQPATYLVCVSRHDGSVVWQKQPQDLDPSLENAFFHGTPIASYDRIYVLMRRSQVSGFHDAFIAAVDASSGKMIWRRHLSSAASGQRFAARPLAQMTFVHGRLYVADNLGVVTCLDGRSGSVVWSSLMSEAMGDSAPALTWSRSVLSSPSDPPILVEAGLVVPPGIAGSASVLLDAQTGKLIRELNDPVWVQAQSIAQAGSDVLVLGVNVSCFDGKTLEQRWVHEGDEPPVAPPVVVGDTVLVPRRNRLVALDLESGRLKADLRSNAAAGLIIDEGQVILTTSRSVASYMPWARAYASLTRQMHADANDPGPGVALAYVAIALNKPEAVLEGVDHAVAALRRSASGEAEAAANTQVFHQLLSFAQSSRVTDLELRRKLFQRISGATTTAADEVAYRLALGEFEAETGQLQAAVDHYQSILLDDTLAEQLFAQDGAIRQAWMEARRRLGVLVEQHGQPIYARHDAAATMRMNELITTRNSDPQLLEDLARRYPLSKAAPLALIAAADALASRGNLDGAMPLLRQAYRQARQIEVAAEAVGRLAQLSLRMDRPRIARRWLETAARQHEGIRPVRDGLATPLDRWLSELAAIDGGVDAVPSLQLPLGSAQLIDGRLLASPVRRVFTLPRDRILLQRGATVEMRDGPALEHRWTTATGIEQPMQLLWLDEEQAVLWSPTGGRLASLNAATGRRLRSDLDLTPLLDSVGDHRNRMASRTPEQQRFVQDMLEPQPVIIRQGGELRVLDPGAIVVGENGPSLFAACNEWVIVLADELGRVACIDRRDGQTLWRFLTPMQRISALHLNDDTLIVAGVTDPGTDAQGGMVLVLDPTTGERRCPPLEVKDVLQYVAANESLVVYATSNEVAGHHLTDGVVAWRLGLDDRVLSGQGWIEGDSLVLGESGPTPGLIVIDAAEGKVLRRLVGADLGGGGEHPDLQKVGNRWQMCAPKMVAAIDEAGGMLWRDAVAAEGSRFLGQFAADELVVAIATAEGVADRNNAFGRAGEINLQLRLRAAQIDVMAGEQIAVEPRRYTIYAFDREGGRLLAEYQLGPLPASLDLTAATLLDGRIAITCGSQTLILPGAIPGALPGAGAGE